MSPFSVKLLHLRYLLFMFQTPAQVFLINHMQPSMGWGWTKSTSPYLQFIHQPSPHASILHSPSPCATAIVLSTNKTSQARPTSPATSPRPPRPPPPPPCWCAWIARNKENHSGIFCLAKEWAEVLLRWEMIKNWEKMKRRNILMINGLERSGTGTMWSLIFWGMIKVRQPHESDQQSTFTIHATLYNV